MQGFFILGAEKRKHPERPSHTTKLK